MSKRDRNRQEAIWELLQTERAYIRSLQIILDVSSWKFNQALNIQYYTLACKVFHNNGLNFRI